MTLLVDPALVSASAGVDSIAAGVVGAGTLGAVPGDGGGVAAGD